MIRLADRALRALIALVIVGALFAGATGSVRATADHIYIGFNAHANGGSCADPDFTAAGTNDSAQIALAVAATNMNGTLHFCPGTYHIDTTINLSGSEITLQGTNATSAVLDGGGATQILTSTGAITVSDLTLHGGYSDHDGGAIKATTVTVTDSIFTNNTADSGGAIHANVATVAHSSFTNNTAALYYGGALQIGVYGRIVSSRFVGNRAFGTDGGAIETGGNLDTRHSYFANNSALAEGSLDTDLDSDSGGGALWVGGEWSDVRSTFVENWAGYEGGAVFAHEYCATGRKCYGHSRIVGTVFRDNFARQGGGAIATDFGDLTITRARFIGNSTLGWGGALLLNGDNIDSDYEDCGMSTENNCSLTVTRTQFSRNRAPSGQASIMVMANESNSRVAFRGCLFGYVQRDSIISTFARVHGVRHIVLSEYLNP
jgi:predicted outer membrane repeat protein